MWKHSKSNLIWIFFMTDESFRGSVYMWLTQREVVFLEENFRLSVRHLEVTITHLKKIEMLDGKIGEMCMQN